MNNQEAYPIAPVYILDPVRGEFRPSEETKNSRKLRTRLRMEKSLSIEKKTKALVAMARELNLEVDDLIRGLNREWDSAT